MATKASFGVPALYNYFVYVRLVSGEVWRLYISCVTTCVKSRENHVRIQLSSRLHCVHANRIRRVAWDFKIFKLVMRSCV